MFTVIRCPFCAGKHEVQQPPIPGTLLRCPNCQQTFSFGPPTGAAQFGSMSPRNLPQPTAPDRPALDFTAPITPGMPALSMPDCPPLCPPDKAATPNSSFPPPSVSDVPATSAPDYLAAGPPSARPHQRRTTWPPAYSAFRPCPRPTIRPPVRRSCRPYQRCRTCSSVRRVRMGCTCPTVRLLFRRACRPHRGRLARRRSRGSLSVFPSPAYRSRRRGRRRRRSSIFRFRPSSTPARNQTPVPRLPTRRDRPTRRPDAPALNTRAPSVSSAKEKK